MCLAIRRCLLGYAGQEDVIGRRMRNEALQRRECAGGKVEEHHEGYADSEGRAPGH